MCERSDLLDEALRASPDDVRCVSEMLAEADESAPPFWETGREIWVPVEEAEIRVLHCPTGADTPLRPVVLVPGFGVIPEGFQEFYRAVHGKAHFYYVETREKSSSRLRGRRPDMSVSGSIRDLSRVFDFVGLTGRDFVLVAACWGATIVLEGLISGNLDAPTIVLADPMHTLWFPRWLLRWVSPALPAAAVKLLRPILFKALVGDMREPVQKARVRAFVYGADVRKWKRSAEAAREVELLGRLHAVHREVFVLNGTADKIHDPRYYPLMARELPGGRFLHMSVREDQRERLFGTAAREFARVPAGSLPPSLARFEKPVRSSSAAETGSILKR
jgi:hypothetical protein